MQMLVVLFVIAQNWKEFKCPSTDEYIKKTVVHPEKLILLSHKKTVLLTPATTWNDFKTFMLNLF